MPGKEDFAVDLGEEILTEAAHTLFSKRAQLDREAQAFFRAAAKLREQMFQTLDLAQTLGALVIEPEKLYAALGVEPKDLLRADGRDVSLDALKAPFRVTCKGRYTALVKQVYGRLVAEAEKYNHGELYRDPETGLMKRTLHYEELVEWHQELNGRLVKQNENLPSYSLQLAKSLNTDLCQKEKVMSSCGTGGPELDRKLAFKGIAFSSTGLLNIPVLPPVRKVRRKLHRFLQEVYARHQGEIRHLLGKGRA